MLSPNSPHLRDYLKKFRKVNGVFVAELERYSCYKCLTECAATAGNTIVIDTVTYPACSIRSAGKSIIVQEPPRHLLLAHSDKPKNGPLSFAADEHFEFCGEYLLRFTHRRLSHLGAKYEFRSGGLVMFNSREGVAGHVEAVVADSSRKLWQLRDKGQGAQSMPSNQKFEDFNSIILSKVL